MWIAEHGIIQSNKNYIPPFILDQYGGASFAYSLRKLSSTYSGSAIRVRRSSDNTEQDIGFTILGELDQSSLLSFVGSNSGYVSIWYDQSTNGRNAIQSTLSRQPRIVNAGTIEKQNSKPSIFFYSNTPTTSMSMVTTISSVSQPITWIDVTYLTLDYNSFRVAGAFGSNNFAWGYNNTAQLFFYTTTGIVVSRSRPTKLELFFGVANQTNSSISINGVATTGSINNVTVNNYMMAGNNSSIYYQQYKSEVIIYQSDQISNRMGMQSNINSYYSIY